MLFLFQTFGLYRILYFGCYRCWAFRPFVTVLTFILYEDYYYLSCIIILFSLLSIYFILKVAGVTFWYQSYLLIVTFYYVNRGVTFWYQSGFRPGSDPGWRFLETWFYSVLTVLDDFKIFSGIWEF